MLKYSLGTWNFVDSTLQTANSIEHSYFSCGSILNSNTSSAKHSVFNDSCELLRVRKDLNFCAVFVFLLYAKNHDSCNQGDVFPYVSCMLRIFMLILLVMKGGNAMMG